MKTRLNKILTIITAVTFVAALTLNVQASLNDPFSGMSDAAIMQTTSDTSGETTGGPGAGRCKCFDYGQSRYCAASTAMSPRAKCSRTQPNDPDIPGCWTNYPPCIF